MLLCKADSTASTMYCRKDPHMVQCIGTHLPETVCCSRGMRASASNSPRPESPMPPAKRSMMARLRVPTFLLGALPPCCCCLAPCLFCPATFAGLLACMYHHRLLKFPKEHKCHLRTMLCLKGGHLLSVVTLHIVKSKCTLVSVPLTQLEGPLHFWCLVC